MANQTVTIAYQILNDVMSFANSSMVEIARIGGSFEELATIPDVEIPHQETNHIDFNRAIEALDNIMADLPTTPDIIDISRDTPAAPDLDEVPSITEVNIPEFTGTVPTLAIPDAPIGEEFESPVVPSLTIPTAPESPTYTNPEEPILLPVEPPPTLQLDLPIFEEVFIDEDLLVPSNTYEFDEQEYSSAMNDALQNGLLDMMENGNYGLDPADEDRLFQAAREKEQMIADEAIEEAINTATMSGFPLPTGALAKFVERAQKDYTEKVSSINRDLALKRADLIYEGKKFTYEQVRQTEDMLRNFHNVTMERSLNAAKAQIQVAIDLYNASLAGFTAKRERYLALAQVFQTRVGAELAKVEMYKGQVEATKILTEQNKVTIDLYNAKINAIKNILDNFRIEVEAYNVTATVQRTRMEIYRAEVEGFAARVQAKKAEYEAYEAQIKGETAKAEAYEAEANAYSAIVEGKKAQIESYVAEIQAIVAKNKGEIDAFSAEADVLNSLRTSQVQYNQNQVGIYQGDIQAFAAKAGALTGAYDLSSRAEDLEYRNRVATLQANNDTAQTQLQRVVAIANLQIEATKAQSDAYRSIAASSFSAMNCNASLSDSFSDSISNSTSDNTSKVTSDSSNTTNSVSTSINTNSNYGDSTVRNIQSGTMKQETDMDYKVTYKNTQRVSSEQEVDSDSYQDIDYHVYSS